MTVEEKKGISIKTLLKLAIPIFLELILQVLLGNIDKRRKKLYNG